MASPELQKVLKLIDDRPRPLVSPTRQQIRQAMEDRSFPATHAARIAPFDANGVPGEWVTVAESDPNRRVLYFHGGGYVYGSAVTHRRLCEDIAAAGRCAVLNLDYRLAPEHPFPAAVDDAIAGLKFVRANGPNGEDEAESLFVAGDSAGGGLTLATLLAARERGIDQPNAAIAISAWTDLAITGESVTSLPDDDPEKSSSMVLEELADQYLHGADPENPARLAALCGLRRVTAAIAAGRGRGDAALGYDQGRGTRALGRRRRGRRGLGRDVPRLAPVRAHAARRSAGNRTDRRVHQPARVARLRVPSAKGESHAIRGVPAGRRSDAGSGRQHDRSGAQHRGTARRDGRGLQLSAAGRHLAHGGRCQRRPGRMDRVARIRP